MPTYDYQCDACGHTFEEFQSITAKPLRKCPECSKLQLKRLIGTGGGDHLQGRRILRDGLSQRVVQEGRRGGEEVQLAQQGI
jgi:putative FmdB family regulatory protein